MSNESNTISKVSAKEAESAFADFYLQHATQEFGDDLAKLQKAPDFKDGSIEVIVEGLKQGQSTFDKEDRVRIGRAMLDKRGKEE